MKLSAKPKSSPGRIDDFRPPLIMFPRTKSNRGSRSRANPLFFRKINAGNEATQEPSSPKVTCIGQVRVKRSNNKHTATTTVRRCKWFQKRKPRWLRRVWRGKIWFFRCDCCGKSEKLQEAKANQVKREIGNVIGAGIDELISNSPPRNAFLLTRSRSDPYRYSSEADEMFELIRVEREENEGIDEGIEEEGGEDEGSINGDEEFKAKQKPLNLSRCKSEPARTGDKLFMSLSFGS